MLMCRVEGNATSTVRHPSLKGWRLLICQPMTEANKPEGMPILSLDDLGAGLHDRVVVTSDGKSVSQRVGDRHTPARYMTIAILDTDHSGVPKGGVSQ